MFGGIAFMIKNRMAAGINKDDLMIRGKEEDYEKALSHSADREMDFTGRPLKGFLYIDESGFKTEKALVKWLELSLNYVNSLKKKK